MKIFDFRERKVCSLSCSYGFFTGMMFGVGIFAKYSLSNFIILLIFLILSIVFHRNLPLKNEKENP